jgi:hypothetical protein
MFCDRQIPAVPYQVAFHSRCRGCRTIKLTWSVFKHDCLFVQESVCVHVCSCNIVYLNFRPEMLKIKHFISQLRCQLLTEIFHRFLYQQNATRDGDVVIILWTDILELLVQISTNYQLSCARFLWFSTKIVVSNGNASNLYSGGFQSNLGQALTFLTGFSLFSSVPPGKCQDRSFS